MHKGKNPNTKRKHKKNKWRPTVRKETKEKDPQKKNGGYEQEKEQPKQRKLEKKVEMTRTVMGLSENRKRIKEVKEKLKSRKRKTK